jgi:hypothetical protein
MMWDPRVAMMALLLSVTACGGSGAPVTNPSPKSAERSKSASAGPIQVRIDNQNFNDMNVYLVTGGSRWLLGQAGGVSLTTLTIPNGIAPADLRLRLLADPLGGQAPITTPTLIVPRGQRIYWTIGSDPAMSTTSTG